MKFTKYKLLLVIIFAVILVAMLVRQDEINTALNYLFDSVVQEESFPMEEEDQIALPLGEGEVFSQIITIEERADQIGIRFATYMRTNTSIYEFEFYTIDGLLLGRSTIRAESLVDNEYQWFSLSRDTIAGEEYELRITAEEVPAGNEIAIYTSVQEGYQYNVDENSFDGSAVIGYRYLIEVEYMEWVYIGYAILFIMLFFWKIWTRWLWKIWTAVKKIFVYKRLIVYIGIVICGIIGCVFALFHTRISSNTVFFSSDGINMNVLPMENGIEYRQEIADGIIWNQIGIRLATYTQVYQSGEITIAFYDGNSLIEEMAESAEEIEDNQYFYVDFQPDSSYEDLNIVLSVELPDGQNCGIYYSQTGDMDYELLYIEKKADWLSIIFWIGVIAVGSGLFLAEKKSNWKKWLRLAGCIAAGIVCGVLVYTYSVFGNVTPDAIRKSLGLVERSTVLLEYDENDCSEGRYEWVTYYLGGGGNSKGLQYVINGIKSRVDSIALTVDPYSIPYRQQTILVYYDTGEGFRDEERVEFQFVYKGETEITIPFSDTEQVMNIRIDFGDVVQFLNDIEIYSVRNIKINSKNIWNNTMLFWLLIFGVLLGGVVWGWKEYKIEEKIRTGRLRKYLCHEFIFVVLSIVIGGIMSVIIPMLQVPDELNHMRMALEFEKDVEESIGDSVIGVMDHAGISVNIESYEKLLWTEQPKDIELHISLRNIAYPGQTIGAIIAYSFNLPVFWISTFAELGALIVYTVIGYFAIKKMPFNKTLIMSILLAPMMMQQAGSWSYDSFNNALCVYVVAYIFYLRNEPRKIGWKPIIWLFSCGILLLYIKKGYVISLLLLAIIHSEKFEFRIGKRTIRLSECLRSPVFWGIIGGGACIVVGIILYILNSQSAGALLLDYIREPEYLILAIGKTLVNRWEFYYESMLGYFGWLDFKMINIYYVVVTILLLYFSVTCNGTERQVKSLLFRERLIIAGTLIMGSVLVCASMLSWTLRVEGIENLNVSDLIYIESIEGVQGRYFLPFLPLLLLLPRKKLFKGTYRSLILAIYFLVIPVWTIGELYVRYWR